MLHLLARRIDRRFQSVDPEWVDGAGEEFVPLGNDWLGELLTFAVANQEDLEKDLEDRIEEMKHRN